MSITTKGAGEEGGNSDTAPPEQLHKDPQRATQQTAQNGKDTARMLMTLGLRDVSEMGSKNSHHMR